MDRRGFVKAAASAAALFACGAFFNQTQNNIAAFAISNDDDFRAIEKSIKAGFGSGFRLLSYTLQKQKIVAKVEHLQNIYVITSVDWAEWNIVSSNIS